MADEKEYNDLLAQKRNVQQRAEATERSIYSLNVRIDRLKKAKRILDQQENNFDDVCDSVKEISRDDYQWQGMKYDSFLAKSDNLLHNCRSYHSYLDSVRDQVNMELCRLENQVYDQRGLLGRLHSSLNYLTHRIENFFN